VKIDRLILGEYATNCYVLRSSETAKDGVIIDTGLAAERLMDFLRRNNLNPVAVVLTHGHIDHIAGVTVLRGEYPHIKVYIHKFDAEMLTTASSNLSVLTGALFSTEPADILVEDKSVIEQAGIKLKVLHTPGHTAGGICLYSKDEGIVFTDDTLFADSIGRTDFPGGSMTQLLKNVKEKLFTLPGNTIVYPGHGPVTTIEQEKTHNQFFR